MMDIPDGAMPGAALGFLAAPGELGGLIRTFDWPATPLEPLASWPQRLRTSVSLILDTRHPMWIGWGKHAAFPYNDAYVDVLGAAKHPHGRWAALRRQCGARSGTCAARWATGVRARRGDLRYGVQLCMGRGDFLEETGYSFSCSPILDEGGRVGGLFCPSLEISASVLNERRLATLSRLSADTLREQTVQAACATAPGSRTPGSSR
jgi:hypothetical protein